MLIDAIGLGLFTASGVGIALEMKTPILPVAFIGVITATFSGVIRDILSNQKPLLFQPTEPIYAHFGDRLQFETPILIQNRKMQLSLESHLILNKDMRSVI